MVELKTCPFCGNKVDYAYDLGLEPYGIHCSHCHALIRFIKIKPVRNGEVFERFMRDVAEKWNKRQGRY